MSQNNVAISKAVNYKPAACNSIVNEEFFILAFSILLNVTTGIIHLVRLHFCSLTLLIWSKHSLEVGKVSEKT